MEQQPLYQVREPNPIGIPSRWLRFLYRMAGLKGGHIYTITLIVPDKPNCEPQWAIIGAATIENVR